MNRVRKFLGVCLLVFSITLRLMITERNTAIMAKLKSHIDTSADISHQNVIIDKDNDKPKKEDHIGDEINEDIMRGDAKNNDKNQTYYNSDIRRDDFKKKDNGTDVRTEEKIIRDDKYMEKYKIFLGRDIVNKRLVTSSGKLVKVVILVASSARSGSSFIGELLSQQDNSIYFYEPIYYLLYLNSTINGTNILHDMTYCRISSAYVRWLRRMPPTRTIEHPLTRQKCAKKACLTVSKLTAACRKESNRIIKVIRIRMRWMKVLLDDPCIDLKVIHLVRDPRATIISRGITFAAKNLKVEYHCPAIEDDLHTTPQLMREYPSKVMGITYEDFCIDPTGRATEMWRFISGNKNAKLPTAWAKYIQVHTAGPPPTKRDYAYSTFRNSSMEYQEWRLQINISALLEIEESCESTLNLLGYNLFGSLNQTRNLDIPLFVDDRIPYTLRSS